MENTTTSSSTSASPSPVEAMANASRTLADSVSVLAGAIGSLSETSGQSRQSQAPTAVKDTAAASMNAGPSHIFKVMGAYGKYVAMFVGAGLISGSLVHFPLAPARYLMIGACGAVLFTIGSVVGEFHSNKSSPGRILLIVIASLVLSIGIGMVSGGIQHFQDFPSRAAKLIPLGIGLSVGAFVLRHGYKLNAAHHGWLAAATIFVMALCGVGLSAVAESSTPTTDHHGSETPATTSADPKAITTTTAASSGHGH